MAQKMNPLSKVNAKKESGVEPPHSKLAAASGGFVGALRGAVAVTLAVAGNIEGDLIEPLTVRRGIFAGDAGAAQVAAVASDGAGDGFHRQITHRVAAQHLRHASLRGVGQLAV